MPLSRQQLPSTGPEDAVRPRLRAAAFDLRKPVTRRAAALEALFRADWRRAAPRSRRNLALTAESYLRARIVVEHVLAPRAGPLRSLSWLLGTPEATAVRQVTEVPSTRDGRPQPDGMLTEALVHACWSGKRPVLSSESVIGTLWPKHEAKATRMVEHPGIATDPAAWATNRIVRVGPGSAKQKCLRTPAHKGKRGHPNAIAER